MKLIRVTPETMGAVERFVEKTGEELINEIGVHPIGLYFDIEGLPEEEERYGEYVEENVSGEAEMLFVIGEETCNRWYTISVKEYREMGLFGD